jgi:tetratricopeptide (TPR) repeat protein
MPRLKAKTSRQVFFSHRVYVGYIQYNVLSLVLFPALRLYSAAIGESLGDRDNLKLLLCNRAACYLKLNKFQECTEDCSAALEIDKSCVKAYFRRAQAHLQTGDANAAARDLSIVLKLDPSNKDAIAALREATRLIQQSASDNTEIKRTFDLLDKGTDTENCLKHLISICSDDASHCLDLARRGRHLWLASFISDRIAENSENSVRLASCAVRVLIALCQHKQFVSAAVVIANNSDAEDPSSLPAAGVVEGNKLSFEGICSWIDSPFGDISRAATTLVLRILQVSARACIYMFLSLTLINLIHVLIKDVAKWRPD